jgi:hypothetical protein
VLQLNNKAGKFTDLVISADGRVLIGTAAYPGGPFCQDPMWVSTSGRQALVTCSSNSPAGHLSVSVLLLGHNGAARLRQLEAVMHNDLVAFGR